MINLILNDDRYENDIRALLMAFYHGEKILVRKNMEVSEEELERLQEQLVWSFLFMIRMLEKLI